MDKNTNGPKRPEDNDGVQTLPRPSRKGNLANVVAPIPMKIGPSVAKKEGRKRKEKEEKRG
jgi:hypothetical protein